MITPESLKFVSKAHGTYDHDLERAVEGALRQALKQAEKGRSKAIIHPPIEKIGDVFYYDEKQEIISQELTRRGFDCRKERNTIGGVLQDPNWYIYF